MDDVTRDEQVRAWVEAGPDDEVLEYEGEVMWGVWFNLDDEGPPVAMFGAEEDADAYAKGRNRPEWNVSPCLVEMKTRNHYDVPKRTPAEPSSP